MAEIKKTIDKNIMSIMLALKFVSNIISVLKSIKEIYTSISFVFNTINNTIIKQKKINKLLIIKIVNSFL